MSRTVLLLNEKQKFTECRPVLLDNPWIKDKAVLIFAVLTAVALPIIAPYVHLGIISTLWKEFNYPVDRKTCSCSCWDTVFKGRYESGVAAYKHVYFNVTSNTFKIWSVTVLYLLGLYEGAKRTVILALEGRLRLSMLLLLLTVIYPHYYSWWSYFNYWNDDFYSQWYHQLYFSTTELISTLVVIRLLDKKITPHPRELLAILTIAALHISASFYDQFLTNVIRGEGRLHQVLRDLGFMVPDMLHFGIPWMELRKSFALSRTFSSQDFVAVAAFIILSWIFIAVS